MDAAIVCFREGFLPFLSLEEREALLRALRSRDPRLVRGRTTEPPPLAICLDWPVERADPVAYALWQGRGLTTVDEVEGAWAQACAACDQRLGWSGACSQFLSAWDDLSDEAFPAACDALAALIEGAIVLPPAAAVAG